MKKQLNWTRKIFWRILGLAKLALESGQLDKAKEYANKALAIDDKTINAYLLLADVAYKQKDNAEVEKVLLTAQEKVKGNINAEVEVIKSLGKFYALRNNRKKFCPYAKIWTNVIPITAWRCLLAQAQIINNKKPSAEETLQNY